MRHWIDGQPASELPADDRGLTLGDGHFTTMLVVDGQVRLWPLHRERLCHASRTLGLACPDWDAIEAEVAAVAQGTKRGILRLTLTRGSAGRGYQGQWGATPRRILSQAPYPDHYDAWRADGIDAGLAHLRLAIGGPLAGLKTLGRLEQVLVKQELAQTDVADMLVRGTDDRLVCASAGNLFVVKGGVVLTPSLARAGIAGVTRRALMQWLSQHGPKVRCAGLTLEDLASAESVVITNALMGAVALNSVESHCFKRPAWLDDFNQALMSGTLEHD